MTYVRLVQRRKYSNKFRNDQLIALFFHKNMGNNPPKPFLSCACGPLNPPNTVVSGQGGGSLLRHAARQDEVHLLEHVATPSAVGILEDEGAVGLHGGDAGVEGFARGHVDVRV